MGYDPNDPEAVKRYENLVAHYKQLRAARKVAENSSLNEDLSAPQSNPALTANNLLPEEGHPNLSQPNDSNNQGHVSVLGSSGTSLESSEVAGSYETSTIKDEPIDEKIILESKLVSRFPVTPPRAPKQMLQSLDEDSNENRSTAASYNDRNLTKDSHSSSPQHESLFVPNHNSHRVYDSWVPEPGRYSPMSADTGYSQERTDHSSSGPDPFEPRLLAASSVYTERRSTGYANPRIHPRSSLPAYKKDEDSNDLLRQAKSFERQNADGSGPENWDSDSFKASPNGSHWTEPAWIHGPAKKNLKINRNLIDELTKIRNLMDIMDKPNNMKTHLIDKIRIQLHKLEHMSIDRNLVRRSKLLNNSYGLPRLFNSKYPDDIREDALALANRWRAQDFDSYILRGISYAKTSRTNRTSATLDLNFPAKRKANFFGAGDLVNGQWWPTQLATLRDGAHGSTEGGIYGIKDKGAVSVVISGSSYQDSDNGDNIWYCGTEAKEGKNEATDNTKLLMANAKDKSGNKPVRVIRSHHLPKTNAYRPEAGFRYDGLYDVTDCQLLNPAKQHYRFFLVRQAGQDPIRYMGPTKRPTEADMTAFRKHQTEIRLCYST